MPSNPDWVTVRTTSRPRRGNQSSSAARRISDRDVRDLQGEREATASLTNRRTDRASPHTAKPNRRHPARPSAELKRSAGRQRGHVTNPAEPAMGIKEYRTIG